MKDCKLFLSRAKFYEGYARYDDELGRYETWDEAVDRVFRMHETRYKDVMTDELSSLMEEAKLAYKQQLVLGAQRALQFGGDQLLKHHMKLFNCTSSYADRPAFFGECFYILLCGCGVGFSVQRHHVDRLPHIRLRTKQPKTHVVEDSIEGWATALDVLLSSYFEGGGKHPEFEGRRVYFDLSLIRPKGALISGGFKAPGPEPLRLALDKIEYLLQGLILRSQNKTMVKMRPIDVYDVVMHTADAVLSGGVRRAATICLFSADDEEMMRAKTGNWFTENPQRARANNSAVIVRNKIKRDQFHALMGNIKEFGEPGFLFVESEEHCVNPCFTGDTVVAVADGRNGVTIKELAERGDEFPVYSARRKLNGASGWKTEVKRATAFKTGTRKVINVILSDGTSFRCTEEHRLAKSAGGYVPAIKSMGVELQGFFSRHHKKNYRMINSVSNGFAQQHRYIWEYHNGIKPEGYHIDHIVPGSGDFVENLQLLKEDEHNTKTGTERLGKNNPVHRISDIDGWRNRMAFRSFMKNNPRYSGVTDEEILSAAFEVHDMGCNITFDNLRKINSRIPKTFSKNRFGGNIQNLRDIISGKMMYEEPACPEYKDKEIISHSYENPTVIAIVDSDEIEDVYDLCVDDNHNFYILTDGDTNFMNSTGVLVHNCVEIGMFPQIEERSGFQGCVSHDTKLITKTGIATIGDTVGKEIDIWNGKRWSTVKPIMTGTNRTLYRVVFGDGSYLDCTDNHKFLVKNRFETTYRELTTAELGMALITEPFTLSVPRADIIHNDGIEERYAYDYGWIIGDGTVRPGFAPFSAVYEDEWDNDYPFAVKMGEVKEPKQREGKPVGNLRFRDITFTHVDRDFALRLKKENGLPREIFSWDRGSMKAFIAGWIDTDGTVTTNGGFRIYGREDHIRDLQLLLTKLGVASSVNLMARAGEVTNVGRRNHDVWYVQVVDCRDLYCHKGRLTSKTIKAKGKYQTIRSITELPGQHDSFCFEEPELHQGVFNNVLTKQCNLSEINGGLCDDPETFYRACRVASIIGTLQAGYTDFKFVTEDTKKIFEREALLGVSITGWMNNPQVLFDDKVLRKGADIVKKTNREVAKLIGINPAARTTCVKPSGTASILLQTASGIHAEHSEMYIRNVQMNKESEVAQLIKKTNPHMVEESVWSATNSDYVISFPIVSKKGSIFKDDMIGVKHLELIAKAQKNWVEAGTNVDLCVDPTLRHNVSNTVLVDDWDEVEEYIFKNRKSFSGIALLSLMGDKDFAQAPNVEVIRGDEIVRLYGTGAMFASGLIVEGLTAFGDLWVACRTAHGFGEDISSEDHTNVMKKDWIRRFNKYAVNYFKDDKKQAEYCLKDVYNLHKWEKIQQNLHEVDWAEASKFAKKYVEIATQGAAACVGVGPNGEEGCMI